MDEIQTQRLTILGDPVGSGNIFYLMKAPRDLTVLAAYMTSENTQNAGTAVLLRLENWGTAGTAVEGTVTANLGGTATAKVLTARVPAAATVDASEAYISEGEWLVVDYTEEGTGWIAGDIFTYQVDYVLGLSQAAG